MNKKGSPTHPQPQASSHPLLNKEGSVNCDWFLELFSERRVSPCQDSTQVQLIKYTMFFLGAHCTKELTGLYFKYYFYQASWLLLLLFNYYGKK